MTDRSEDRERWRDQHSAEVEDALRSGEAANIKRLYVDLGSHLEAAYGADLDAVPQLSLPETPGAVVRLLTGVRGLVLDAGCGPDPAASVAVADAEPGRRLVALDLGEGTVQLARARAARVGVELAVIVGDLEALPFRAGAFQGVICDDTIEHVPDDTTGIAELCRVTDVGGSIALATPNRRSASVLRQKGRDRLRRRQRKASDYFVAESHLREYTWAELGTLVTPHARILQRETVGWSPRLVARPALARPLSGPFLRRFDRMLVVLLTPRTSARPASAPGLQTLLDGVEGWLDLTEAQQLHHAAMRRARAGREIHVVEIGSWKGRSTIALAAGLRDGGAIGTVHAIDSHGLARDGGLAEADTWSAFLDNIASAGVADLVIPTRGFSDDARRDFDDCWPVEVLYIDGSHELADVEQDVECWAPLLASGAVIGFNDAGFPGVEGAVRAHVLRRKGPFRHPWFVYNTLFFEHHPHQRWTWRDDVALARARLFLIWYRRLAMIWNRVVARAPTPVMAPLGQLAWIVNRVLLPRRPPG